MQREQTNDVRKPTIYDNLSMHVFSNFKILTALVLGHNVSGGVRWWTDCTHSIPGNDSELESVSSGQTGHSELGLADISEVASQPFASTLAPLHTVAHNFAATVPLGDFPLQGDRVSGYVDADGVARWI